MCYYAVFVDGAYRGYVSSWDQQEAYEKISNGRWGHGGALTTRQYITLKDLLENVRRLQRL